MKLAVKVGNLSRASETCRRAGDPRRTMSVFSNTGQIIKKNQGREGKCPLWKQAQTLISASKLFFLSCPAHCTPALWLPWYYFLFCLFLNFFPISGPFTCCDFLPLCRCLSPQTLNVSLSSLHVIYQRLYYM